MKKETLAKLTYIALIILLLTIAGAVALDHFYNSNSNEITVSLNKCDFCRNQEREYESILVNKYKGIFNCKTENGMLSNIYMEDVNNTIRRIGEKTK